MISYTKYANQIISLNPVSLRIQLVVWNYRDVLLNLQGLL
jgi:hypothetical protein